MLPAFPEGTIFRSNHPISLARTACYWRDNEACKLWVQYLLDEGQSSGQKMSASLSFPRGQLVVLQVPLTTQKDPASLFSTYFCSYKERHETSLKFRLLQRPCLLQNHWLSA